MTDKELFLSMKTYEEFDRRRKEFKELKMDRDILEHMRKIFPKVSDTKEELCKTPPSLGGTIGR